MRQLLPILADALQSAGFPLGVGWHLRVRQLLAQLPDDTPDDQLRDALCAVTARDPEDQDRFHEIFKQTLPEWKRRLAEYDLSLPEPKPGQATEPPGPTPSPAKHLRLWATLAAVAAALALVVGWAIWRYLNIPPPPPDIVWSNISVAAGSNTIVAPDSTVLRDFGAPVDAIFDDNADTLRRTPFADYALRNDGGVLVQARDSLGTDTLPILLENKSGQTRLWEIVMQIERSRASAAPPPLPHLPYLSDHRAARDSLLLALRAPETSTLQVWLARYHWPLKAALLLLLAAALYLLLQWRERRRPLTAARERSDQPPYVWNIRLDEGRGLEFSDTFYAIANRLRRRESADARRLDLPRTISATIEHGGLPEFRYRDVTRPPEYLLLIDRQDTNDHRAALFDAIAAAFKKQEVLLERFFFSSDPRLCWNEEHPNGTGIRELLYRYPSARLLLLSDGYRLLSSGRLAPWTQVLDTWKQRALLSPVPPALWQLPERRLAERFTVLPALLDSLDFLSELDQHVETGLFPLTSSPGARGQSDNQANEPPVALGGPLIPTLRRYYSDAQIRWIAACAVWPSLHYDLTLWLGRWLRVTASPRATPAPTSPRATPAPTSPRATPAPTSPRATPAPTSPRATPPPTPPLKGRGDVERAATTSRPPSLLGEGSGVGLHGEGPGARLTRLLRRIFSPLITPPIPNPQSPIPNPPITTDDLRQFTRLEWFVQGRIPDHDRLSLLEWLEKNSPGLLRRIQAALYGLLKAQKAPAPQSVASPGYQMHLALLGWMSADDPAERARHAEELKKLIGRARPDVTALKTLHRRSLLDVLIPPTLRRRVHPGGFPALGWTPFWRDAALAGSLWLLTLAGSLLWQPQPPDTCPGEQVQFQNQTLCLQTPAHHALYRERLACDTIRHSSLESLGISGDSLLFARHLSLIHILTQSVHDLSPPGDSARAAYEHYVAVAFYNKGVDFARRADSVLAKSPATDPEYQSTKSFACAFFQKAFDTDSTLSAARGGLAWCQSGLVAADADRYANARARYLVAAFRDLFAQKGYVFEENYPNIIGFRKTQNRTPDAWDDYVLLLYRDDAGTWQSGVYTATTMPGIAAVQAADSRGGAAMIAPGQYPNAYTPGQNRPGTDRASTALRQTGTITIYRDKNKSFSIDAGDPSSTGNAFGLHFHATSRTNTPISIGNWSAGAIVLPRIADWNAFQAIYEKAYAAAQRPFTFTLLTQTDAPAAWNYLAGTATATAGQPTTDNRQPATDNQQPATAEASTYTPGRRPGEDMLRVAGGTFTMGCQDENRDGNNCYDDEKPPHNVTLNDFLIDRTEVTNAQYAAFLNEYGSDKVKAGAYQGQTMIEEYRWGVQQDAKDGQWRPAPGYEQHPVVYVTWYGANEYARHYGLRLPTEAEWEYAARGGARSQGYLYSGSNNLDEVGWYSANSGGTTHPVGQKKANELGLKDMSGNVWEWVEDDWHDNFQNAPTDGKAWLDVKGRGTYRVYRGGSWRFDAQSCRAACRDFGTPASRGSGVGFRVASSPQ